MIEVRQEDRDRAADLMEDQKPLWHPYIQEIRDGKNDSNAVVVAFAAHRQQAEDAMRERCAVIANKSASICPPGQSRIAARIATAIRGIDAGGEG